LLTKRSHVTLLNKVIRNNYLLKITVYYNLSQSNIKSRK
jgi:hypothetical protein